MFQKEGASGRAGVGRWARRRPMLLVVVACVALAVVSLPLPAAHSYDPWAWLVWGREIGRLDLNTTGGPSWKPLPVLVTAGLSPFGEGAAVLWLVAARAAGLLTLVAAFRLAARFAGSAAGALAVVFLILAPGAGSRFLRMVVEGHSAPVTALLTLWAVERHLDGKRAHALLLGTGLALLRPEAWPFLLCYAAWLWRREPRHRTLTVMSLLVVPVLWFGGDWWGSGDPWHGADAAQVAGGGLLDRVELGLRRSLSVVAAPVWVAAGGVVLSARRRDDPTLPALGGLAIAWLVIVSGMAVVLGYAALSRFLLPTAALLCVLAGVGMVRAVRWVPRRTGPVVVAGLLALLAAASLVPRVLILDDVADDVRGEARLVQDLDAVLATFDGRPTFITCDRRVVLDGWGVPRMALAWKLDAPLGAVEGELGEAGAEGVVFARVGSDLDDELAGAAAATREDLRGLAREPLTDVVRVVAQSSEWRVYVVNCSVVI